MSQHDCEQGIAGDVEGNSKAHVRRALVQLAGKLSIGAIELDQAMAGRQGHLVQVCWVPGAHEDATVVRLCPDQVNDIGQLVNSLATVVSVHVHILGAKVPPLESIDGSQVPLLPVIETHTVQEGPTTVSVPDAHVLLLQLLGGGGAPDELEHLLGGEQGKHTVSKGEAHLSAKEGKGPSASSVTFLVASLNNLPDQVQILHLLMLLRSLVLLMISIHCVGLIGLGHIAIAGSVGKSVCHASLLTRSLKKCYQA